MITRDDLPEDVLLFHAPPLMWAHNLQDGDIGVTGYAHHAEYLVWDGLKAPMQTFSLKSLLSPKLPDENSLSTPLLRALQPFFWRKHDDYIKAQKNYIEAQQKDPGRKFAPPTRFHKPHEIRNKLMPNWEDRDQELENMEFMVKGDHYKENVAKACDQGSKSHAACNSVKQGAFGFDHLRRYLTFIQNRFEPKYQLRMLAMMLTLMTDVYHKKDMVEVVGQLKGKSGTW